MKTSLLSILFLLIFSSVNGQIISNTSSIFIPCCSYADSLDMDGDLNYEFKVSSIYLGTLVGFVSYTQSNIIISDVSVNFGSNFSFIEEHHTDALSVTSQSSWFGWEPNTGSRYYGLAKINAPGDTTFAWVELDFRGANNPQSSTILDTFFILGYGYNTNSNERITAGQTSLNGISELEKHTIKVFPNPASKNFQIQFISEINHINEIEIYNLLGEKIYSSTIIINSGENNFQINTSEINNGVYFLKFKSGSFTKKLIINK